MKYIVVISILFSLKVNAQQNTGGRISAMAETGVVLADSWSINANQAGMRVIVKPVISVAYKRNMFATQIVTQSATFQLPVKAYFNINYKSPTLFKSNPSYISLIHSF